MAKVIHAVQLAPQMSVPARAMAMTGISEAHGASDRTRRRSKTLGGVHCAISLRSPLAATSALTRLARRKVYRGTRRLSSIPTQMPEVQETAIPRYRDEQRPPGTGIGRTKTIFQGTESPTGVNVPLGSFAKRVLPTPSPFARTYAGYGLS